MWKLFQHFSHDKFDHLYWCYLTLCKAFHKTLWYSRWRLKPGSLPLSAQLGSLWAWGQVLAAHSTRHSPLNVCSSDGTYSSQNQKQRKFKINFFKVASLQRNTPSLGRTQDVPWAFNSSNILHCVDLLLNWAGSHVYWVWQKISVFSLYLFRENIYLFFLQELSNFCYKIVRQRILVCCINPQISAMFALASHV